MKKYNEFEIKAIEKKFKSLNIIEIRNLGGRVGFTIGFVKDGVELWARRTMQQEKIDIESIVEIINKEYQSYIQTAQKTPTEQKNYVEMTLSFKYNEKILSLRQDSWIDFIALYESVLQDGIKKPENFLHFDSYYNYCIENTSIEKLTPHIDSAIISITD